MRIRRFSRCYYITEEQVQGRTKCFPHKTFLSYFVKNASRVNGLLNVRKPLHLNTVPWLLREVSRFGWNSPEEFRWHSHPRCWIADSVLRFLLLSTCATFLRLLGSKISPLRAQTDSSLLVNILPSFPLPPELPACHYTPHSNMLLPGHIVMPYSKTLSPYTQFNFLQKHSVY